MPNNEYRGDWRQVQASYRQLSQSAASADHDGPSDRVAGYLAYRLGRTFAQYDRHESEFVRDLLDCCAEVDHRTPDEEGFKALYFDKRFNNFTTYAAPGRRGRPRPFEAAVETTRRMVAVNQIRDACWDLPTAALLGGSVSYGRFYNTKGATNDASDLDLLVVLPGIDTSLPSLVEALGSVPGIRDRDVEALGARVGDIAARAAERKHLSASHTFHMWGDRDRDPLLEPYGIPGDYKVQLHMFSLAEFRYMLLDDLRAIEAVSAEDGSELDLDRTMWDYRDDEPHRGTTTTEFCFAGTAHDSIRQVEPAGTGFLAEEAVFYINDTRFYPGIFHNLVMPQFEVRWDRPEFNIKLLVTVYQNKVLDRLTREKQLRPWEDQTLGNSHIRSRSFAPHIWRKNLNSSGDLL